MLPLLVLGCGLLLALFIVYRFAYAPFQVWKRIGVKGPTPVPFFGNYRQKSKMTTLKFYEHLQQTYGSVAGFYIGQMPQILITDLDMLKQILVKDFSNFMDRAEIAFGSLLPKGPKGLGLSQGEAWRTKRQILTPTFSSLKMKMMTPLIKKSADFLVESFGGKAKSGESFEVFRTYGSFTMETILATAFGRMVNIQQGESDEVTKAAHDQFRQMEEGNAASTDTIVLVTSNFPWLIPILRFLFIHSKQIESAYQLRNVALELVKARKESGKKFKDMLQLMIDATGEEREEDGEDMNAQARENGGKLTDGEVVSQAVGILLAGYETTANTLAYTSYLLALNPEIQEKLQAEIDSYFEEKSDAPVYDACQDITYLDNVIQESLRLYPPAPRTNRLCLQTTTVKGVTIPKGCSVIIPGFLLHKNPQYWKDPEKFDPDRFKAEERAKRPQLAHLPFGFGPRNCIGMRFALLEAKIGLMELLKRYTFVRAPDTEVPLQTVLGITMAPKNGIYLKVINRASC